MVGCSNRATTHTLNSVQAATSATTCTPDGTPTASSARIGARRGRQSSVWNLRTAAGRHTNSDSTSSSSATAQLVAHADPATPIGRNPQWPYTNNQLKN